MAKSSAGGPKLTSQAREFVKQFFEYDVNGRTVAVYTTHINAGHGADCNKTRYEYDGETTRILKRDEIDGVWNSAWDIVS